MELTNILSSQNNQNGDNFTAKSVLARGKQGQMQKLTRRDFQDDRNVGGKESLW